MVTPWGRRCRWFSSLLSVAVFAGILCAGGASPQQTTQPGSPTTTTTTASRIVVFFRDNPKTYTNVLLLRADPGGKEAAVVDTTGEEEQMLDELRDNTRLIDTRGGSESKTNYYYLILMGPKSDMVIQFSTGGMAIGACGSDRLANPILARHLRALLKKVVTDPQERVEMNSIMDRAGGNFDEAVSQPTWHTTSAASPSP